MTNRILISLLLLFAVVPVEAAAILELTSAVQHAGAGRTVMFSGTLRNDGAATVFINGSSSFNDLPLSVNDSIFLQGAPASLAPGAMYSGAMFRVAIPAGAPLGSYAGGFNVLGGSSSNASDLLASSQFGVVVVPVPEPSTICLTAGFAAYCARRRKRPSGSSS
jgi:hypothetical protein